MKIYLKIIDKDLIQYNSDDSKGKKYQYLHDIFEKYDINHEYQYYFSTDIKLIRKIKISKLEGSSEFDNLIEILFDTKKIKFLKDNPNHYGTSGRSGTSGSSGSSRINFQPDVKVDEYQILLDELVKNMIEVSKVPKDHFST